MRRFKSLIVFDRHWSSFKRGDVDLSYIHLSMHRSDVSPNPIISGLVGYFQEFKNITLEYFLTIIVNQHLTLTKWKA